MDIIIIPVLDNNYAYLIVDKSTKIGAVIDPVDPNRVMETASKLGIDLQMILTTHSHWDHHGGNVEMKHLNSKIEVYGGIGDNVDAVTLEVGDGDVINLGKNVEVNVISAPCHTSGHVLYLARNKIDSSQPNALFSGDTIFVGGCGNFNTGTPEQMQRNFEKIAALADDTLIYCGHEYTKRNLQFALYAEPSNEAVRAKLKWAEETRITVPSTVLEEKQTNPFMRVGEKSIQEFTNVSDDKVEIMKQVRRCKDVWGASH